MDRIDRMRTAAFLKSPGGAPPCPHSRPGVTSALTHRESTGELMSADVSVTIMRPGNNKSLINTDYQKIKI